DPARAKDLAPKYLDHEAKGYIFSDKYTLRFAAALIVFQTGDKARARSILGDSLERGDVDDFYIRDGFADAVDLLLKEGTPESRKQARRVFSNQRLRSGAGWF